MVVVGLVLHVALLPVFLVAGLVVPPLAVAGLLAVWVALLVVAVKWRNRRPGFVLATPLIALVVLVAVVSLGEALLDWSA